MSKLYMSDSFALADTWPGQGAGRYALGRNADRSQCVRAARQRSNVRDAPRNRIQSSPSLANGTTKQSFTRSFETTLTGIPPDAWRYQLGNRCAIEWVLDQYKEKKPKDPTIREKFDAYRFADYKEQVIDLLGRVTAVSVGTVRTVEAMRGATR